MYSSLSLIRRYFIGLATCATLCTVLVVINPRMLFYTTDRLHNRFKVTLFPETNSYYHIKSDFFALSTNPIANTSIDIGKFKL